MIIGFDTIVDYCEYLAANLKNKSLLICYNIYVHNHLHLIVIFYKEKKTLR